MCWTIDTLQYWSAVAAAQLTMKLNEVSGTLTAELDLETQVLKVKLLSMLQHAQYQSTVSLAVLS